MRKYLIIAAVTSLTISGNVFADECHDCSVSAEKSVAFAATDLQDWAGHLELLSELSERRRTDTFFVNEQSTEHGLQVGHVNLVRGNLTFLRRDLVTVGRLPFVAGHLYDSRSAGTESFGPGWRLTFDESIEPVGKGLWSYVDESGSRTLIRGDGSAWRWQGRGLIGVDFLRQEWILATATGLEKRFGRIAGAYRLVRVSDTYGNHLAFSYRHGLLDRVSNDSGRFVTLHRDADGRVIRFSDDQERSVSFSYDDAGRLIASTDLGGHEWSYRYGPSLLAEVDDPLGHPALLASYDSLGRAIRAEVRGRSFIYEYRGDTTAVTDGKGQTSTFRHDETGLLVSTLNPLQVESELRFGAESSGPVLLRDGLARETPGDGFLPSAGTATKSGETEVGRAANGDVEWIRLAAGVLYHFAYDKDGQVIEVHGAQGAVTSFEYNDLGRLALARLSDGAVYRYDYDPRGLRLSVESEKQRYSFTYDEARRLDSVRWETADGHGGYDYQLDAANRIVRIVSVSGVGLDIDYDVNGNVVRYGDTVYSYDALDRLVSVSETDGTHLTKVYDAEQPGLLAAADTRTPVHHVAAERASAVYGTVGDIFHSRGRGALLPGLRYDPSSKTLRSLAEDGRASAEPTIKVALLRTQLDRVAQGKTSTFNAGSNAFFLPPEQKAVGCTMNCNVWGLTTRIDGSTSNPVQVEAGDPVVIVSFASSPCVNDETIRYRIDFTNNGSWDLMTNDPALITFYTYPPGTTQTKVLAECRCSGLQSVTITTVQAQQITVTDRTVSQSSTGTMWGLWPNNSGTVAVNIFFSNTLREEYTVRETFINGTLDKRQILAGYSTLVTSPNGGFPSALPYNAISLLNARHRYENPGATPWLTMGGPTGPIFIGPDSVFKQVTSSVTFPEGVTGNGQVEVEAMALGGHAGGPFTFPIPSIISGPNGLANDVTETPVKF